MIDNRGAKNPMYGKKHSDEAKRKISEARKGKYTGENHPGWKGGKSVTGNGYIQIHMPEHHRARNGYVFEHILEAEKKIGRKLLPNEIVHHKNRDKKDNSPENLEVLDRGEHTILHSKERRKGKEVPCTTCGKTIYRKPSHIKAKNYCSSSCFGKSSNIGLLNKKISDEQILELLEQRLSIKEASEKLGVYQSTIYRRLKKIKEDQSC